MTNYSKKWGVVMNEKEAVEVIHNAMEQSRKVLVELTDIKDKAERIGCVGNRAVPHICPYCGKKTEIIQDN